MRTIDKNNYEAYLLDYFEGNLSEPQCAELKMFVVLHPEFGIDLEDKRLPGFAVENLEADFKTILKKTELDFPDEVLLNYLDNNLSETEKQVLERKLLTDSELAADLKIYETTRLRADHDEVFDNKTNLLKSDDDFVQNDRVIAYFENTLSVSENHEFTSALKIDSDLKKAFELVSKTKLAADQSVCYPNKEELKRRNKIIALFEIKRVSAIAAAVLLLATFGFVFRYYYPISKTTGHGIADKVISKRNIKQRKQINATKRNEFTRKDGNKITTLAVTAVVKPKIKLGKRVLAVSSQSLADSLAEDKEIQHYQTLVEKETVKQDQINPSESAMENSQPEPELTKVTSAVADENSAGRKVLTTLEEIEDDEQVADTGDSFWKKAVKLAKRMNQFGIKSVDGQQKSDKTYALSFNSIGIERH